MLKPNGRKQSGSNNIIRKRKHWRSNDRFGFNTVATYVRRLEAHGMIRHEAIGPKFYVYEAAVTKEQYANAFSKENIKKLFGGSYIDFISRLVEEREVSVNELKELIELVEHN